MIPSQPPEPEDRPDSTENDAAPRYGYPSPRCSTTEFLWLLVTQLLCLALLAPPDNGHWLHDTLVVVLGLNVLAYLAFNLRDLRQYSRFSRMAMALFFNAILAGFVY